MWIGAFPGPDLQQSPLEENEKNCNADRIVHVSSQRPGWLKKADCSKVGGNGSPLLRRAVAIISPSWDPPEFDFYYGEFWPVPPHRVRFLLPLA